MTLKTIFFRSASAILLHLRQTPQWKVDRVSSFFASCISRSLEIDAFSNIAKSYFVWFKFFCCCFLLGSSIFVSLFHFFCFTFRCFSFLSTWLYFLSTAIVLLSFWHLQVISHSCFVFFSSAVVFSFIFLSLNFDLILLFNLLLINFLMMLFGTSFTLYWKILFSVFSPSNLSVWLGRILFQFSPWALMTYQHLFLQIPLYFGGKFSKTLVWGRMMFSLKKFFSDA